MVDGKAKYFRAITREEHLNSLDSGIRNKDKFTQQDSDLFAHFIQVVCVMQHSTWYKMITNGTLQINMNQDGKTRALMPPLELTAFALLYIRQLISNKDDLVNKACNKYKCFIANDEKRAYIDELKNEFNSYLNCDLTEISHYVVLEKYVKSNRELIDSFAYGALIIHGTQKTDQEHRKRYKSMYLEDSHAKPRFIWELNSAIMQVLSKASRIAVLLQTDFVKWQQAGIAPDPDVFWQETMFTWSPPVQEDQTDSTSNAPPVFGRAYNVQFSHKKVK